MGAYSSKNFFKCVSTGIKYLNTMPAWKASYLGKRKHTKYRVAPTTSSFFNLLKGVQHRYPQLTYKQVVAVGTQVWNQMTWSEKKPYYMLAWKEQLKKEVRHKRYSQQFDFNRKLRLPGSNGRYDLRSNTRRITNTPPPPQEMCVSEDPNYINLQAQEFPAESQTFNALKNDVVAVVNDMAFRASETALNIRKYRSSARRDLII